MKLLLERWKRYLNEANYSGPPLNYSAVVLTNPDIVLREAEKLKDQIPPEFVNKEGKWPHHMTINMGPLLEGWENDAPMTLTINGWGIVNDETGKAMAFRVDPNSLNGLPVKNKVPHISTLVPPDGKPFHSNKIVNWQDSEPFGVKGVVVAQQQKKQKKPPQQKSKGSGNPVEFAREKAQQLGNNPKMTPEKIQAIIKNIIMKKFNKTEQAALGIMRGAGI